MAQFNEDQMQAIRASNQNLLISAAAGSGKTTVMIRKIVEDLTATDKSLDQYLVITFTRDAADHMRRKLEEELLRAAAGEDPLASARARRALRGLDGASISTIHTFCLRTIREHFDAAGVSADVKAIDADLPDQLFAPAYIDGVEDIFQGRTEDDAEDRHAVAALFRALTQEEAREAVRALYETLMGIPRPFDQLEEMLRQPWEAWAGEVREGVRLDLEEVKAIAERERQLLDDPWLPDSCVPVLEEDLDILDAFRPEEATAESLAGMKERFSGTRVSKAPPPAMAVYEEVKKLRGRLRGSKNLFDAAARQLAALTDPSQQADNDRILIELRGLRTVLKAVFRAYQQAKQDLSAVDFSDMEQLTWQLMQDPEIRAEMMARYTDVYVDETQDVSAIQDALIQSFRGEGHTVFMVGDIKQSIYRFRHAEPELFDRKRQSYSDEEAAEARRIFFRDNYRSCRAVIDCVNAVFRTCMTREVTEMDYAPEDWLRANREGAFGPVEICLVDAAAVPDPEDAQGTGTAEEQVPAEETLTEEEPLTLLEAQSREAAEIIRRLLREGYHCRDIVILLRSAKNDAPKIADYLGKMHIPAFYDGPRSFYGLPEIAFFLDLLTVIQNERTDVELFGALKNLPFSFSDEELADIRLEKRDGAFWEAFRFCADRKEKLIDHRCAEVRERLAAWRVTAASMPAADFLWQLMRDTGFYASRGSYPDGALRQANLDALYQKALDLAARGAIRLPDFLMEVRKVQIADQKSADTPSALGSGEDLVRIMTMHGSKGLEYPAVILMNLHKSLRRRQAASPLRVEMGGSRPLGLYLPLSDRPRHYRRDTFGKRAFEVRAQRNAIAEETRLLYVALTRAENRLFLLGGVREGDWARWKSGARLSRIWQTQSMLDMVMPAVLAETGRPGPGEIREAGDWRLTVTAPRRAENPEEPDALPFEEALRRVLEEAPEERPEGLWTAEPHDPSPLKTSVTTLVHGMDPHRAEDEETVETKRLPETVLSTFRLSELPRRPAFLEEERAPGAAEIGTAMHRFLRLIDLAPLREGAGTGACLRAQMDRMLAEGVLTGEEADRIRPDRVARFLETPLGRRLISAEEIHREWPFTLRLSPEKPTLLQGVIDAAFRDPEGWVLLDYKTDRDTRRETFVSRHMLQMNWYRVAVERVTGIPVKEMWLVALRDAASYPVPRVDPAHPEGTAG